jgi:hypothetical protein
MIVPHLLLPQRHAAHRRSIARFSQEKGEGLKNELKELLDRDATALEHTDHVYR